ncbi:MAG TPA: hypothetical protein VES19_12275 [Candidatus Limnocylindrales bacterium]|nr:hypothetical protein [Candidatus Limnocylindrales bacterium]
MQPNVLLPLLSSLLSFVLALFLLDQWLERRRSYQLIWTIGIVWYGISAGTEFLGAAYGWSEPLYRAWYLIGAVYVAAWLGLGTMYLLGKTRFGYGAAFSVLLAGLFTVLSQAKAQYTDTGILPYAAFAIAALGALLIAIETYRGTGRWAWIAGALIIGGSVVAIPIVLTAAIPAPGYALDPNGIPVGTAMPGSVRLLTPLFNVTGGFALALGALYSTYMFMPKKRVVRYELSRDQGVGRFLFNLLLAPLAITVNLLASIPGAFKALVTGNLHSRVPATILLAIGGFIPSLTSGLSRFGVTETFFLGEFLGVVFLFAGTLVSVEVFREFRIPFTRRVLHVRSETA